MGEEVEQRNFTREDRAKYRHKIRRSLDVFASMLREARFEFERPLTGMEIGLNLIDEKCDPAMRNAEVLSAIADQIGEGSAWAPDHGQWQFYELLARGSGIRAGTTEILRNIPGERVLGLPKD